MSETVTHTNSPSTEPPVLELTPAAADTVVTNDHGAEGVDSAPVGKTAGVKTAAQEAAAQRKALQQLRYGHATDGASSLAYPVPDGREAMPVAPKDVREKVCCYVPYTAPQSTRARSYFRKFTSQEVLTPSGELVTMQIKPTTFAELMAISLALELLKSGQRDLLNDCLMRDFSASAGLTVGDHQMTRTLLNCLGPINILNWVRDFELPVYQALGQEVTDAWADPKESNLTCCEAEIPARPNAALVKTYTQALGERAARWPEALRPLIADLVKVLRECMPSQLHDYLCTLQRLLQLNSRDFYAALHQLGQSLPKFFALAALVKPQAWEASGHDMNKLLTATKIQPKTKQATKKAANKKPTAKKPTTKQQSAKQRTTKATRATETTAEATPEVTAETTTDATLAVPETSPVDLKSAAVTLPAADGTDAVASDAPALTEVTSAAASAAAASGAADSSASALSAAEPDASAEAKAEVVAPSSGCQVSRLTRAVNYALVEQNEDMVLGVTHVDNTNSADSAPRGGLEIIIEYDPKDEAEAALMDLLCSDEASMSANMRTLGLLAEKVAQLKAKERPAGVAAPDAESQLPSGAEAGAVTNAVVAQSAAPASAFGEVAVTRQSAPGSTHTQKLRQRHKQQRQQRKQARRHRK